MRTPRNCATCATPIGLVYNAGNPIWVELEPVAGGELVLRGDPAHPVPGEFVAAFFGIGPEGDDFFGIPAGAPRYRRHEHIKKGTSS